MQSLALDFSYHSYAQLEELMQHYAVTYPNLTRLYSIGRSVQGRQLWVMEISDQPGVHEPGEPEFKYLANMHGNEVTGRETLLYLMQFLCDNYTSDSRVRMLVDSTRIHLLPSVNPDGFEVASTAKATQYASVMQLLGRYNVNGVDLNRNFPDRFSRSSGRIQPETRAIIDWLKEYPFVLSANFHNGALVANYPYDNSISGADIYTPTSNDDVFVQLALSYSLAHPTMHMGHACGETFPDGITNGADWYSINGGMQDYNYLHSNCMELTIEQGCTKFPPASALEGIWGDNLGPMLAFLEQVHHGVKGFVRNSTGNTVAGASVSVAGRGHDVFTAADGDYWRLLVPGEYVLTASASGYMAGNVRVTVVDGSAVVANFTLEECGASGCARAQGGANQPHPSVLTALALALLV